MSKGETTRAASPSRSGKRFGAGGISFGKKALSVFMSVVLVAGLNPGLAMADIQAGSSPDLSNDAVRTMEDPDPSPAADPADTVEYTVTFDYNGGMLGENASGTVKVASTDTSVEAPAPTKTGYELTGWKNGDTTVDLAHMEFTGDITLQAQWSANSYKVSFNPNGGAVDPASATVTYDAVYGTLPVPTRTGYEFQGWFTKVTGGTQVNAETTVATASDHTLYAVWAASNQYVAFDMQVGDDDEVTGMDAYKASGWDSEKQILTVAYGQKYGELPVLSRDGYRFDGWYIGAVDEWGFVMFFDWVAAGTIVNVAGTQENAPQTLYASWSPNNYTVTFDAKGGEVDEESAVVMFGDEYGYGRYGEEWIFDQLPVPVREGYDFGGWFLLDGDGELTETQIENETPVTIMDDITVGAKWLPKTFDLAFETNGGQFVSPYEAPQSYTVGTGVTLPTDEQIKRVLTPESGTQGEDGYVAEVDYVFDGWFDNPSFTGEPVSAIEEDAMGAKTFYAKWSVPEGSDAELFDVSFVDDSEILLTLQVEKGSLVSADAAFNLTKVGHDLDCWYTLNGEEEVTFEFEQATITADTTLHAKWKAKEFKLTFNVNGADQPSNVPETTVVYGQQYAGLPVAKSGEDDAVGMARAGYTFSGWFTDENDGTTQIRNGDTVEITQDTTLVARWDANICKLTLDANGGEFADGTCTTYSGTYNEWGYFDEDGANCGMFPEPTREGYTFAGFFTKDSETGDLTRQITATDIVVSITEDTTVYAKWEALPVKLTLDANGGNFQPEATVEYNVEYDDAKYADGDFPTPVRAGYTFQGFFAQDDQGELTGDSVTASSKVTFTQDTTVYAKWAANSHKVTLNNNYGDSPETSEITVAFGDTYAELPTLERPGYTFDGWFTDATGGNQVQPSDVVAKDEAETLFAHWSIINYNLTYESNGATGNAPSNGTYTVEAEEITLPNNLERTDFEFDGWYDNAALSGEAVTSIQQGSTGDKTFYAKWKAETAVTVTFNSDGGTDVVSQQVLSGNKVQKPADPTKEGYEFKGWKLGDADFAFDSETPSMSTATVTENTTLKAEWQPVSVTVVFDAQNGTDGASNVVYSNADQEYDAICILPDDPTRQGYRFDGWFTDATDGAKVESGSTSKFAEDTTLYAHWTANTYTVWFDANDGIMPDGAPDRVEVTYDQLYPVDEFPAAGIRTGYTTDGEWYTDATGGTKITTETKVALDGDQTLYLHWTPIEYHITYNLQGGELKTDSDGALYTNPASYNADTPTFTLRNPQMEGYDFLGWLIISIDGEPVLDASYEKQVTITPGAESGQLLGDLEYMANWTPKYHTVKFVDDDGTVMSSERYRYNTVSSAITVPEMAGKENVNGKDYAFMGWDKPIADVTEDVIYTAVYNEGAYHEFSITYENLNGATAPSQTTYTAEANVTLAAPTNTPAGYDFAGWFDNEELVGSPVTLIAKDTGADVTLFAKWTPQTYTIEYTLNGGANNASNPATFTVEDDDITLAAPTKDGYTFSKWVSTDNESVEIMKIAKGTAANQKVTAKWIANLGSIAAIPDQYLVEEGTGVEPTITVFDAAGSAVNASELSIEFANNATVGTATVTVSPKEGATTIAGDPLTATFNIVAAPGDKEGLLAEIEAATAQMEGVQTADDAEAIAALNSGTAYASTSDIAALEDAIAAAQAVAEKEDATDAEITEAASDLKAAENAFAAAVKTATTDKAALADAITAAQAKLDSFANVTDDGSTVPKDQTYITPDQKTALEDAIAAAQAYVDGESKDASQNAINDAAAALVDATSGLVGSSGTKPYEYTVTFNSNGGSEVASATVTEDETVAKPEDPAKAGYELDKWTTDGTAEFDFTTPISSDLTLIAAWKVATYNIDYDLKGASWASEPTTKTYTIDNSVTLPTASDLTAPDATDDVEYTFDGWFESSDFTGSAVTVIAKGSFGDKTFYAKWKSTPKDTQTRQTQDGVTVEGNALATTPGEEADGTMRVLEVKNQSDVALRVEAAKANVSDAATAAQKATAEQTLASANKVMLYEVDLKLVDADQPEIVKGELTEPSQVGELTLTFEVGAEYNGYKATVFHVHEAASGEKTLITYRTQKVAEGNVVVRVNQLSEFTIALQVDKSELETLINSATNTKNNTPEGETADMVDKGKKYATAAQKATLQNAIDAAQAVVDDPAVDDVAVTAAKTALQGAIDDFNGAIASQVGTKDKSALEALINSATKTKASTTQGTNAASVAKGTHFATPAQMTALQNAINAAKAVDAAAGTSQANIDSARQTLQQALNTFNNAVAKQVGTKDTGKDMYRLYNPYSGEHFYTENASERNNLVKVGWKSEGVGWVAPTSGADVYRLYNPYEPLGDHHYTPNAAERDHLVSVGWRYEGVGWKSGGNVNVLRQYNPYAYGLGQSGAHNYTKDKKENDYLASIGWHAEGVAWKALA